MKKLILICLLAVAASGCKVSSTIANGKYPVIGMSETEFKAVNRNAQLVYLTSDSSTYEIYRSRNEILLTSDFYYFGNGKLSRFEQKTHYFNNSTIKVEDSKTTKN